MGRNSEKEFKQVHNRTLITGKWLINIGSAPMSRWVWRKVIVFHIGYAPMSKEIHTSFFTQNYHRPQDHQEDNNQIYTRMRALDDQKLDNPRTRTFELNDSANDSPQNLSRPCDDGRKDDNGQRMLDM